jgi:hypothetical protein
VDLIRVISEHGHVSGSYEISDEFPSFIKFRELLGKLRNFYFPEMIVPLNCFIFVAIIIIIIIDVDRGSSVGIASSYWMNCPWIESR